MKHRYMLLLCLILICGILFSGCQQETLSVSPAPSATATASASAELAAPAQETESTVASSGELFPLPEVIDEIVNVADHVNDFEYKDIKADDLNGAWLEVMQRAKITGYPAGMLEYAEYSIYQGYEGMAAQYNLDFDTMLKEKMNVARDEMKQQIEEEARAYLDAGIAARYILEKENIVTLENLEKINSYYQTDEADAYVPTVYDISTTDALLLADLWLQENAVV